MDRDEVIRISRLVSFGGLTDSDISNILINYCLEHSKPQHETTLFVTFLLTNRILLLAYFDYALEYYEKKFAICKLWSNQGQRKLLQIF